ncbi:class I SAM-dependent methyltransferase [Sphingorhabdus buctiana]|jgi:SAM-dependent methyltransferase|uniref:Class I SAM-dependent methyltransferase n=1 Tax=Sphingorhabdus buctiana TaxID=1508805 RepID=A0ABW4MFG7_9SPHN
MTQQSEWQPRPAGWWERVMVPKLIGCACAQPQIMKARSRIVPKAEGDVLELGCGGGINMAFYDPARLKSFSGVDPSAGLLDRSREAAQAIGIEADIRGGVGEAIPFASESFDTVLCTFTLCSVDDQKQVLAEMRRVLRPGGKILFLEHGSAPDEDVRKWQRRIEPIWKRIGGNCHLTRPITSAYEAAGFKVGGGDKGYMPKSPRPFSWIEWGEARI